MPGIQFFGVEETVDAWVDYAADCWGVVESKDLIKTGCSGGELSDYLNKLCRHGSAATYTLRVYRGVDEPESITARTEYSACFKFKLNESTVSSVRGVTRAGGMDAITEKLNGIVAAQVGEIIDRKLNREDDDEKETISDAILGLIKQPEKLIGVLQGIRGLFSPTNVVGHPDAQYGAVSGIQVARRAGAVREPEQAPVASAPPGAPQVEGKELPQLLDDETLDRVAAVLGRLERADPEILAHLEQLADLAEQKPETYKMGIKMLS